MDHSGVACLPETSCPPLIMNFSGLSNDKLFERISQYLRHSDVVDYPQSYEPNVPAPSPQAGEPLPLEAPTF